MILKGDLKKKKLLFSLFLLGVAETNSFISNASILETEEQIVNEENKEYYEHLASISIAKDEFTEEDLKQYIYQTYYFMSPAELEVFKENIQQEAVLAGNLSLSDYDIYMGFYQLSMISNEIKEQLIQDVLQLSNEMIHNVQAGVSAEATMDGTNYADSYWVINNLCARANDATWSHSYGNNVYSQLNARGQYAVVPKRQSQFFQYYGSLSYQATIDRLFVESLRFAMYQDSTVIPIIEEKIGLEILDLIPTPYLNFLSAQNKKSGRVQVTSRGNNFYKRSTEQIVPLPVIMIHDYQNELVHEEASILLERK